MGFPYLSIVIIIGSIFGLYFGAEWIVNSAVRIARRLGISPLVIGLTIVAIGTSAPEFAVTISSAFRDQADISVGNIVGSNIFNIGFILGGIAMFRIIPTTRLLVTRDGGMLIGTAFLLLIFLRDGQLQSWEGVVFLVILVSYILLLIFRRVELDEDLEEGEFRIIYIGIF
ncbi:MAG: sodium:calcium antiporter, partial [Chloroflexota bacterium]